MIHKMYSFCLVVVQCLTQLLNTGPSMVRGSCQENTPNSAITYPVSTTLDHTGSISVVEYFPGNGLAMSQILLIFLNTTSTQKLYSVDTKISSREKYVVYIEFFNL